MALTPQGYDHTFTRDELLRVRNLIVTKDTDPSEETSDRNEQVSDSDEDEE
jgi:hypothetical protein